MCGLRTGLNFRNATAFVLPMVKVPKRPSPNAPRETYQEGIQTMRAMPVKRYGGLSLDKIIEPKALNFCWNTAPDTLAIW